MDAQLPAIRLIGWLDVDLIFLRYKESSKMILDLKSGCLEKFLKQEV